MFAKMRPMFALSMFALLSLCAVSMLGCADDSANAATLEVTDQVVEASCGMCKLGMEGTSCELAVRIDGKSYYVDGGGEDVHDSAHDEGGICTTIREARVTGKVVDGRFKAEKFEMLPLETTDATDKTDEADTTDKSEKSEG